MTRPAATACPFVILIAPFLCAQEEGILWQAAAGAGDR